MTLGLKKGLATAALMLCLATAAIAQQAPQTAPDAAQNSFQPHRPPVEKAIGPRGTKNSSNNHGPWWANPAVIEKLKLTDEQRTNIDAIVQQHKLKLVDLRGTLQKQEIILGPMLEADQLDESKILAQIDKVASARAQLEKANARLLFGIRRQLTPEQWKTLQGMRKDDDLKFAGKGNAANGGFVPGHP